MTEITNATTGAYGSAHGPSENAAPRKPLSLPPLTDCDGCRMCGILQRRREARTGGDRGRKRGSTRRRRDGGWKERSCTRGEEADIGRGNESCVQFSSAATRPKARHCCWVSRITAFIRLVVVLVCARYAPPLVRDVQCFPISFID